MREGVVVQDSKLGLERDQNRMPSVRGVQLNCKGGRTHFETDEENCKRLAPQGTILLRISYQLCMYLM